MVLFHHRFIRQQIFLTVGTALHTVIGSGIQTIPASIDLYIIPHMKIIAAIRRPVTPLHQNAPDSQCIQHCLHCSGIPFTQTLSFNKGTVGSADIFVAAVSRRIYRTFYDGIIYIDYLLSDRFGLLLRTLHNRINLIFMLLYRTLNRALTGKALCIIIVSSAGSQRCPIHHRIIFRYTGSRYRFL